MTISQIYQQYQIPINLQQHMLRVAAIGNIICENIDDVQIDNELVVKTLLLHDMGNILKIDCNNPELFVLADKNKIDYYRQVQNDIKQKYGSDADEVTISIIRKITSDTSIADLCANTHGEHVSSFLHTNQWNHKLCYYSDMRIGPYGILPVDERFSDLKSRYPNEDKMEKYHQECKILEAQIQEVASIDLQSISNKELKAQFKQLNKVEI